eukprot:1713438-Pyramimonas_sp.AAC.1
MENVSEAHRAPGLASRRPPMLEPRSLASTALNLSQPGRSVSLQRVQGARRADAVCGCPSSRTLCGELL